MTQDEDPADAPMTEREAQMLARGIARLECAIEEARAELRAWEIQRSRSGGGVVIPFRRPKPSE